MIIKTINERITKMTDLEANDSLSSFEGHAAQQYHGAYEVFFNFFKTVKPKRILEIGTALGGFTMFMKIITEELNLNTKILTFDIYSRPWYDEMRDNGIDVRVEDIFDDFSDVPSYVKDFIQEEGTTIVLCDGGWKKGEFNLLSKFIKNGDYILAHDYAENSEVFQTKINKKIWNWHEIQDSDIIDASMENGLEIFEKELFENVVWTCRIKK
jgi:cephalosporin hydroxylase